jgi:hypothetical protein
MIVALTGAFSGVFCALIASAFGFAFSKGKRFDFWVLIVGALFGLIAVQLGAAFFGWQEWVYVIAALALFEYGGKAVYVRGKRGLEEGVHVDAGNVLMWAFIIGCAVYVVWWIVAFFTWFYPMVGNTFVFTEVNWKGEEVFRWFAINMPEIDRNAIAAYLIFGLPAFCFLVASPFAFAISNFINKKRDEYE